MNKLLLSLSLLLMISSCTTTPKSSEITGSITPNTYSRIYLYSVEDEIYGAITLLDSIVVKDGKFSYPADSLSEKLYAISLQDDRKEPLDQFSYLFLSPKGMTLDISFEDDGKMAIKSSGSAIDSMYRAFAEKIANAGNKEAIDSLDNLFYQAREKNDEKALIAIKNASIPYYDEQQQEVSKIISDEIANNQGTPFGLYLTFTYRVGHELYNTVSEIDSVMNSIKSDKQELTSSPYYKSINSALESMKLSAIGSVAPEIAGVTTDDKEIKLSDFRGKFVLVDFWSSGCSWCRKESPTIAAAYNRYKNKNFTVLGVSSDFQKEPWIKAIKEDKNNWDNLLIPKDQIRSTMGKYCITGIPYIILVDPNGVIVAKDLRGKQISDAIERYVK